MNHLYRLVWNNTNACWQAVAEIARGHHKNTTKSGKTSVANGNDDATKNIVGLNAKPILIKPIAFSVLLAFSAQLFSPLAMAEPTGGQVTAGAGTINQAGAVTTINQATQNMAIDWHTFNVRANEAVNFNQPNANAIALNRVTGTESSSIMGSLTANGRVFILNPNGVLFGAGAQVNVGSLVASTASLSNANFMAGNFNFKGNTGIGNNASIVNNGNINIAEGGTLAFIAPVIKNNGTIIVNQSVASQGSVILAAADDVTLTLQNGGLTSYTLNKGSVQTLIDNGGLIQADGGHVVLTAKGLDALSQSAINHTGIIEAQTVSSINGKIELLGDMQIGTLNVSGKLDASAPTTKNPDGGDGGFVETSAAKVKVADSTRVTTLAANGKNGTWLIDPTDFTVAPSGMGDMTGSAVSNALLGGNFTIQSTVGASGISGNVNIYDEISWSQNTLTLNALNNIYINKSMYGSGTASLSFLYGQGSSDGIASNYYLGLCTKVNLPAGLNFTTQQGAIGQARLYQVINNLGTQNDLNTNTLQGLNGTNGQNFVLGQDIDASSTFSWNNGEGFTPIIPELTNIYFYYLRTITNRLNFGGLGHEVSNLYINKQSSDNVGLFGWLSSGEVRDLNLSATVVGNNYVGGLVGNAGFASGCTNWCGNGNGGNELLFINNIDASVTVSGNQEVGGLIGGGLASVYKSSANVLVSGSHNLGGIAGSLRGYVVESTADGTVNSSVGEVVQTSGVGGLIGYAEAVVDNSYSNVNVNANASDDIAGGLVGVMWLSHITSSYASGQVFGKGIVGGFVGSGDSSGAYYNGANGNYWDIQKTGQTLSAGDIATGKTSAEMQQQSTYVGWDFNNRWTIADGSTTPFFGAKSNSVQIGNQNFTLIHNVYELQEMRQAGYGQYALANDIDASATSGWNNGKGFEAVGVSGSGYGGVPYAFNGDFDGLNHKIEALYINRPDQIGVGLFGHMTNNVGYGYSRNAFIKNVSIENANITGLDGAGILAGVNNGTSIENVHTSGNLTSLSSIDYQSGTGGLFGYGGGFIKNVSSQANISGSHNVGGLVGHSIGVDISNSFAETTINASGSNVGGLVGRSRSLNISQSYSSSVITGKNNVGGLVGASGEEILNNVTITNSYSTGSVSGDDDVGGVLGAAAATTSLNNVYSTSQIISTGDHGGLIGTLLDFNSGNSNIFNSSYWDTSTSSSSVGKLYYYNGNTGYYAVNFNPNSLSNFAVTGKTTTELQQQSTFAGWDFDNVWRISSGDYPRLRALTQGTIVIDPTKTNIGVTAPSVTKVYDGVAVTKVSDGATNDNIANDLASLTGWGNGYTATMNGTPLTDNALFSGTLNYNGANSNWQGAKNAGQYIIDPTGLTAVDPQKYEIRFVAGELTITPRPLIVQALNTFRAEGAANPTSVSVLTSGLVEGENISKVIVSIEPSALPTAQVGSEHDISPTSTEFSNGLASNYNITYKPGTLAITPADIKGKDWWKNGITESERLQLRGYQIQLNAVKDEIALAGAVYSFSAPEGYELINSTSNPLTGFAAATYRNTTTGKYSVVFRGSESPLTDPNDWLNNVSHIIGVPDQYTEGLIYTRNAISAFGEVDLVGHSLGGGIAMYSAAMTGSDATTFNPAKLWSNSTELVINFTPSNGTGSVKNFVFDNEAVQYAGSDSGYFGGFNKINLYSEGIFGDHYLTHVNAVRATIDQILATNFVIPSLPLTGEGSTLPPDSGALNVSNDLNNNTQDVNIIMDRIIAAHSTLDDIKSDFNWVVIPLLLNPFLSAADKFQIWGDFLNSHSMKLDILDAHRQFMNSNLPASVHDLYDLRRSGDLGWQLVTSPDDSIFHQNNVGKPELKFVNSDGREAVYDGDTGLLISNGDAAGTYNFTTNDASPLDHTLDDILLSREAYRYYASHQSEDGAIDDIGRKIDAAIASRAISIGSYIGL